MLTLPPKFLSELENPARKPFALLQIDSTGQSAEITSESDFGTATSESNVDYDATYKDLTSATYKWTLSVGGTNEYYCEIAAGGDPSLAPQNTLIMDDVWLTKGTLGSLADHEFGYGDNADYDALGYNTIYIADATGDPDTAGQKIEIMGYPPDSGDCILAPDNANESSLTFRPTGDDTNQGNDWSASGGGGLWADIDESVADDDTTYMYAQVANSQDYLADFDNTNILSVANNLQIKEVVLHHRSRWTVSGPSESGTLKSLIRVNGTRYADATADNLTSSYVNYSHKWTTNPNTGLAWTKADLSLIEAFGVELSYLNNTNVRVTQVYLVVTYYDFAATGNIVVPFDLGASAATANKATVSIDDLVPTGGGLTYTAEGSTTGSWGGEEVSLGAVEDGSAMTGYRYYRVTANYTSDGTVTPVLKSIKIEIPDNIYLYSTLDDYILSAYPWLKDIPGRNIKLNLKDMITETSSLTVSLVRNETVDKMVRDNNFRGLNTSIRIGMYTTDITVNDLIPYYQSKISNYSVDETDLKITLKDMTKDLSFKIPAQTGSAKTTISYDKTHVADVINDLLDKAGIASRYIDRGTLDTVEANIGDGTPASKDWVVNRTGNMVLSEPETAKSIITELLEIMGCYMVVQENGKAQFIEYDSTTTAQETWGKNDVLPGFTYKPNLEALRNLCIIYYDWVGKATTAVSGESEADFASILVNSDATSISDWGLTASKIIKNKWLSGDSTDGYYGDELATHIAAREVTRLKDGLGKLSCRTSLDKCGIQVGDFINIDTSDGIDVIFNPSVAEDATRKFLVTSKNWDVGSDIISWELTEAR